MGWADGARAQGARQRRPARPGGDRRGLRRPGHRPVPHRAHVLRRGQDRPDARDDRRRERDGSARGAGQAAAAAARGLRRHLPGHGQPPGDHPDHRSAAARVPAARRGRHARAGPATGQSLEAIKAAHRRAARVEPDARPPRLPPRHHLPGDHRDAGARHLRGRRRRGRRGHQDRARDHDPARRDQEGARQPGRRGARRRPRRSSPRRRTQGEVPGRHHDRDAARRPHRRQDRRDRRVLLLRHQRPHPDHLRPLARRRAQVLATYLDKEIYAVDPFVSIDRDGVGELMRMP